MELVLKHKQAALATFVLVQKDIPEAIAKMILARGFLVSTTASVPSLAVITVAPVLKAMMAIVAK